MCTGIYRPGKHPLFGRNLDLDHGYGEKPLFMPRKVNLPYRAIEPLKEGFAIIGTGILVDGYPLFFDAMNEAGMALAGLNFPGNAVFFPHAEGKNNLTPYELFTYLLRDFSSIEEARPFLARLSILDEPLNGNLPLAPLHYLLVDQKEAIVLESRAEGLLIHENPYGVLTNNPPFEAMVEFLRYHLNETPTYPLNRSGTPLKPTSIGMGSIGLPGDYSSPSRFVKAAYLNQNVVNTGSNRERLDRFFSILDAVAFIEGTALNENEVSEKTIYQVAYDLKEGTYHLRHRQSEAPKRKSLARLDLDESEARYLD